MSLFFITRYWLYGDKCLTDEEKEAGIVRVRGWFPKRCVEKQMVEYTECDHNHASDKEENTKKTD